MALIETEASTIRSSFAENISSGLKMLGNNDRRLGISRPNYNSRLSPGISDNVANLVSQSFSPTKSNGKRNNNRQDAVVIGEIPSSDNANNFMGGMLQLLGFDSSKIGAVAINGIIFIAQMVRYGASKFVDYMVSRSVDLYRFVDYIGERMNNETSTAISPTTMTTTISKLRF